jgi:hypothetical protein
MWSLNTFFPLFLWSTVIYFGPNRVFENYQPTVSHDAESQDIITSTKTRHINQENYEVKTTFRIHSVTKLCLLHDMRQCLLNTRFFGSTDSWNRRYIIELVYAVILLLVLLHYNFYIAITIFILFSAVFLGFSFIFSIACTKDNVLLVWLSNMHVSRRVIFRISLHLPCFFKCPDVYQIHLFI